MVKQAEMTCCEKNAFFANYFAKIQKNVLGQIRFFEAFLRTKIDPSANKKGQMIPWVKWSVERGN